MAEPPSPPESAEDAQARPVPEFDTDERLVELRQQLQRWLRGYTSVKTRLGHAERVGLPRVDVPGLEARRASRAMSPQAWLTWCWHHQVPYLHPSRDDLNRWLDELVARGYAQRSQAAMLASVSSFYQHLIREEVLQANPVDRVDRGARNLRPSKQVKTGSPVSYEQVRALLEAAYLLAGRTRNGRRDRAMLEVLVGCGLRAEELVELDRAGYHRPSPGARAKLTVPGKGGHVRVVGVPVEVADAVDDYHAHLAAAGTLAPTGQAGGRVRQPLFATTTGGGRLHPSHVTALLNRVVDIFTPDPKTPPRERWKRDLLRSAVGARVAAALAPIKGKIGPHRLRHAYGTHALAAGVSMRQVQKDLGHADIATTETYVHDQHQAEHSAAHQLAPGLHRGWLTPTTTAEHARAAERAETPSQTAVPMRHDDTTDES